MLVQSRPSGLLVPFKPEPPQPPWPAELPKHGICAAVWEPVGDGWWKREGKGCNGCRKRDGIEARPHKGFAQWTDFQARCSHCGWVQAPDEGYEVLC